jgi:hypothetical protein
MAPARARREDARRFRGPPGTFPAAARNPIEAHRQETLMNKLLALAIAPLLIASGCASMEGGGGSSAVASAPSTGVQYCNKDHLAANADSLVCNWAPTIAGACETNNVTSLKKSAVNVGPTNAGRCKNGAWLTSVTTH